MPTLRPRRRAAALTPVLALAAAALALAGCGSSSSPGSSADPAGVVPASAPLYAGAVVRPSGALKTDATAAATTLTHQPDSYARLASVLQAPGSPAAHLQPRHRAVAGAQRRDLPLLALHLRRGDHAAAAAAHPGPPGRLLDHAERVAVRIRASRARSCSTPATPRRPPRSSATEAQHAGAHAASYRGVNYQATSGGEAFGIVDRLAVLGTVTGLHSVIDTSLGGPSLVHAADYSKLLASAPSGALAHVYSNPTVAGGAQRGSESARRQRRHPGGRRLRPRAARRASAAWSGCSAAPAR